MKKVEVFPVIGLPIIKEGDNLASLICEAANKQGINRTVPLLQLKQLSRSKIVGTNLAVDGDLKILERNPGYKQESLQVQFKNQFQSLGHSVLGREVPHSIHSCPSALQGFSRYSLPYFHANLTA